MCGRYRLSRIDLLLAAYRALSGGKFEEFSDLRIVPRFNIAPTQIVPILRTEKDGTVKLDLARWGFVPSWTKGKPKLAPINAKSETADTSGLFRSSFAQRRCLVPTDGFYEWQGTRPPKQPFFIHKSDDSLFFFAGLWDRWSQTEGEDPINTFTILTTTPNDLVQNIHSRMPVIVKLQDHAAWLSSSTPLPKIKSILSPYTGQDLEAYPISSSVNNVKNEGPELVKPMEKSK